jgi:hypothetical protein
MAGASARRWSCDGCGVAVSRVDGMPMQLPDTWTTSAEGMFCLGCRRKQAAEAALEAAPANTSRDKRATLRRAGVIEFEVRRAPNRTDRTIAQVCSSSAMAVAAARRRMQLDEGPPPGADRDWAGRAAKSHQGSRP